MEITQGERMAIFQMTLKGCTGWIEIGAESIDQINETLGASAQYVAELKLSDSLQDQEVTDYFNHVTDNPFAHLPFHRNDLKGFIDQLYHARHLCFLADNLAEAQAWHQEYTERGALEVSYAKAFPEQPGKHGDMYNVVIKVFPPKAEQQVGYTPEPEEWLSVDPEFDPCHADRIYNNQALAAQRVAAKRQALGL